MYAVGFISFKDKNEYYYGDPDKVEGVMNSFRQLVKNIWTEIVVVNMFEQQSDGEKYIKGKQQWLSDTKVKFYEV